jgi:hypothetical protein
MSTDIIAGVLRAPDVRQSANSVARPRAAAAERSQTSLFQIISGSVATQDVPKDLIAEVMGAGAAAKAQTAALKLENMDSSRHQAAMQGLEGALMTNVLENMMPQSNSDLYGDSTSGEVWRGFQIEQFANAMASRGILNLGIENPLPQFPGLTSRKIRSFAA